MSAEQSKSTEEQFTEVFVAGERALMSGHGAAAHGPDDTPSSADEQFRLKRNLECVQLLRNVLRPPAVGQAVYLPWSSLGRFQLRRELGRGGFGIVYLAYDPLLGREVALKVPRAEVAVTPELRERLQREARAAAGLDHPNLVPVYEAGEVGPVCFLISAYCPGVTLARWLKQHAAPVPFRDAAQLLATLAEAVGHAHQRGVIHRDLKPGNILLVSGGVVSGGVVSGESSGSTIHHSPLTTYQPKITDFGLAKLSGQEASDYPTRSGAIVGTVGYMAPEQAAGQGRAVGPAADIYALGAILYELLTGGPPFRGETELETLQYVREQEPVPPSRLRPKVPRDLETICLKCLHKDPARRYESAQTLADDLGHFLKGEPIQARPVGRAEKALRWCRRNPRLAWTAGLAIFALLATAAVSAGWAVHSSLMMEELQVANDKTSAKAKELQHESAELKKAIEDLQKEKKATHKLLVQSAGLARDRGLAACEQGYTAEGLTWLARALEILPKDEQVYQEALRTHFAAWTPQLVPLQAYNKFPSYIYDMAFRPDGKAIALLLNANGLSVQLWVDGKPFGPPLPRKSEKGIGCFSPDGRLVLIAAAEKTAQLWDATTFLPVGPPLVHDTPFYRVAFCQVSKRVVTQTLKGAVYWDAATGKALGPPLLHQADFTPFLTDSATAVTSTGTSITLWEVATGKPLRKLPNSNNNALFKPAFSADGKIALLAQNGSVRLCDLSNEGKHFGDPLPYLGSLDPQAVFSPDGKVLLTGALGEIQFRNAATGKPLGKSLPLDRAEKWGISLGTFMAMSPDGKIAVTYRFGAQVWDVARRELIGQIPKHESVIEGVKFAPDGKSILTRTKQRIRLWRLNTGAGLNVLKEGAILALAVAPGGQELLIAHHLKSGKLDQVHAHDLAGGKLLRQIAECQENAKAVAFSGEGRLIALPRAYFDLTLWDTLTGKTIGPAAAPAKDFISAVAFNPTNTLVLTGHDGQKPGAWRLWDAKTGLPIGEPEPTPKGVRAVAFSPDGQTLVIAHEKVAQLFDVATRKPVGKPLRHEYMVQNVGFTPDGKELFTVAGPVQFWDRATGQPLGPPLPHGGGPTVMKFSPNGKILLTAGGSLLQPGINTTVRLWLAADRNPLGLPLSHPSRITAAAFSADGKMLLIGGEKGHVRSWQVPAPMPGPLKRIVLWAQVATGLELDDQGTLQLLDAVAWEQRHRLLQELGGPPFNS